MRMTVRMVPLLLLKHNSSKLHLTAALRTGSPFDRRIKMDLLCFFKVENEVKVAPGR